MTNSVVGIKFIGGFGNQLFQYAFARAYAETYGATLLTPDWIGQKIFVLSNKSLSLDLPYSGFDEIPNGRTNIILNGYFQFQEAINFMSRSKLRTWFQLRSEWKHRFTTHLPIAAHVRRGDYVGLGNIFCLVSEASYIAACKNYNLDVNNVNWVQEGRRTISQDLLSFGLSFMEDFALLMNAQILLRANSSFSWWAAVLGSGRVFSPMVEDRVGMQDIDFVEGNWPRMVDSRNCGSRITDLHLKD
jgi:hypothetical protein